MFFPRRAAFVSQRNCTTDGNKITSYSISIYSNIIQISVTESIRKNNFAACDGARREISQIAIQGRLLDLQQELH